MNNNAPYPMPQFQMPYPYPGNPQGSGDGMKRSKKDKKSKEERKRAKRKGKHKDAFNPALYGGNPPWGFNPNFANFPGGQAGPFPGQFGQPQPDFSGSSPGNFSQSPFNPGAFGSSPASTLEANTNANAVANDGHQQQPAPGNNIIGAPVSTWTVEQACWWLSSLGYTYASFCTAFAELGVDGILLIRMDERNFRTLGITHDLMIKKIESQLEMILTPEERKKRSQYLKKSSSRAAARKKAKKAKRNKKKQKMQQLEEKHVSFDPFPDVGNMQYGEMGPPAGNNRGPMIYE